MGIGQGMGLMFPNGIFNLNNPILTGVINNTLGGVVSGFITTSILTGDMNKGFKAVADPVNIASGAILGGLDGAMKVSNPTKVPVEVIKQNQPVLESLQLKSIPIRTLPQNMLIPPTNVFIPQRTVVPQKFNYNFSQNKYKG